METVSTELQRVAKAATRVQKGRQELHEAIRAARKAGEKLTDIARVSGLGLGTVHRIVNKETPS
jgi:hypothetical protein